MTNENSKKATRQLDKICKNDETICIKGQNAEENLKPAIKDIDLNQYITVRNGFQGQLVYKSKHTGEVFVWDSFGAEQDIELMELKRAKSSNKKFFIFCIL